MYTQISPIPSALFTASLIGFIVAVGLRASKSIKTVLKDYGIKFLILSIVVTASGALSTLILSFLFVPLRFEIIGTYVGALISSLVLGSCVKGFDFNNDVLDAIKNLSLNAFLAIVGLNFGFSAISSIKESGAILLIIGFVTGFVSISSGYIFGKYILKMNRDVLIGGIY